MKSNKIFSAVAVVLIGILSGCSSSFLDNNPTGSTVSQQQYEDNMFSSEAHIRGLYRLMIRVTDHDEFGQKSIDIKTDMISGDIALTGYTYGWFGTCDRLIECSAGAGFNYYIWDYYYTIIKNCNLIIAAKGNANLADPQTPEEFIKADYIGQAYALRGYAYYCLAYYYSQNQFFKGGTDFLARPCVPIYDENSSDAEAQPLATVGRVMDQAEADLLLAVNYLKYYDRDSKTMVNQDVAKVMLAYLYVYRAHYVKDPQQKNEDITACLDLCNDIINGGKYPLLKYDELLTTGFNNVESKNWMWGMDITAETTGHLATFWGVMDVFTYSYAWAGDVKAIDKVLYTSIPGTDKRKEWWGADDKLAPIWKFYDSGRKKGGDRLWLNDIVFMRSEEVYLIAAEAAYLGGHPDDAAKYLMEIVGKRDLTLDETTLEGNIEEQLIYNWRVEMWGEGKAYFTMKRFDHKRTRGDNHYFLPDIPVGAYDDAVSFEIPSSEVKYNPHLYE